MASCGWCSPRPRKQGLGASASADRLLASSVPGRYSLLAKADDQGGARKPVARTAEPGGRRAVLPLLLQRLSLTLKDKAGRKCGACGLAAVTISQAFRCSPP